jgi:uncharacterized membrane protein YsdA (DUF1294 family)
MSYLAILAFVGLYAGAVMAWGVPHLVGIAYGIASVICLIVYYFDKTAAQAGRWRISEKTLLLLGLAGGWPGAALAQQWFRHKSSKPSFRVRFWATVVLNTSAFAYLVSPYSPLQMA